MSYREYFDIDPEYFPQVDKKIIEEQPDLWKKFYLILSILVDTFISKISLPMQPVPEIGSISVA